MSNYWDHLIQRIRTNTNEYIIFENDIEYTREDILKDIETVKSALNKLRLPIRSLIGVISDTNYCQFIGILACGSSNYIPAPLGKHPLSEQKEQYSKKLDHKIHIQRDSKISVKGEKSQGDITIEVDLDSISMVYPTSGTSSGVSKAVLQSYGQLFHTEVAINERMGVSAPVKEIVASPFDNVYWFGRIRCILAVGGSILFVSNPINPLHIIKSLKSNKVDGFSCDTPLLKMMLDYDEKSNGEIFHNLTYVKTASAPLDKKYFINCLEKYPKINLFYNFGLTEAMRTSILILPKEIDKLGSSGRPLTGVDVKIRVNNSVSHSSNIRGEILVCGNNVALGYDDSSAWNAVSEGGFFRTGDCGYLDDQGFLYVLGRLSDAFEVAGDIFFPSEIEEYLAKFSDDKSNFMVVELENSQCVKEYLLVTENNDFNNLKLSEVNKNLADSEFRNIVIRRFVLMENIPKTNNGKYRRSHVRSILVKS